MSDSSTSSQDANDYVVVPQYETAVDNNRESPGVIQKIKTWLSPTDTTSPASEYRKHLNSHVAGTGEWILDTDQFRRWGETDQIGDLWIRGIPGSGKSVVAASMVKRLQQRGDGPVLFFFFREIIEANRTPHSLARDFCNGLLYHSAPLLSALNKLRGQNSTADTTPFSELWKCLSSALCQLPKVYCVVDALDEMESGHDRFLQDLLDLGRKFPKSIKLLLTSRQLPHLEKHLGGACLLDLRLDRRNVDRDIAIYITQRLESETSLTEEEATAIKTAICDQGKGLFLYARLVTDQLLLHPSTIASQLAQLPDGLGSMYTDILRDHASRSQTTEKFQQTMLEWIVYSARPLRLLELATVVDSLPDRGGLSEEQNAKHAIRSTCGALLEVCEDGVIQIIHHSLTEFLLNRDVSHVQDTADRREFPILDAETAHENITRTCINYIIDCCHDQSGALTQEGMTDAGALWQQFHFLRYASTNWPHHAANFHPTDKFISFLDVFFHQSVYFDSWMKLVRPYYRGCGKVSPLHVAAHTGLCAYAEHLLKKGADPECLDRDGKTPLAYAVREGHAATAQVLLNYNARYDWLDECAMAPLHHAAMSNYGEVVRVLIAAGADPLMPIQKRGKQVTPSYIDWSQDNEGKTPMSYACELGNVSVFIELLKHIRPKLLRAGEYLHLAAKNGQADIVRRLLTQEEVRRGVNDRDQQGNTPLYLAAKSQNSEVVQVLLDHGADISLRSLDTSGDNMAISGGTEMQELGFTALHGWAQLDCENWSDINERNPEVLQLLIKEGCDVNATDHKGRTSLFAWSESPRDWENRESINFISSLLENGADASITDLNGEGPLHRASSNIYEEQIVEILVQSGTDVNAARKSDGKTPIHIAADEKTLINPDVFAKANGDFQKQDLQGNTPLHCFFSTWSFFARQVEQWCTLGHSNIRNHAGLTPLQVFLQHTTDDNSNKILDFCVKLGADLECQDNAGRTALLTSLSRRFRDRRRCTPELLRLGADVKAVDFRGRSALHYAVCPGEGSGDESIDASIALIKMLIDAGADINSVDHDGNSIIHETVTGWWHFSRHFTQALVELNAPLYLRNHQGETAIHLAAAIDDTRGTKDTRKGILTQVEYLLHPDFEFDVNAKDNRGVTPLHIAAATSDVNTRQLINHGADILAKTDDGRTPLHYAAEAGQSNCVGLLLEVFRTRSLPFNDLSVEGETALHEAARSGRYESVKLLLDAGSEPRIRDRRGGTALHAAAEFDQAISLRRKRWNYKNYRFKVLQDDDDEDSEDSTKRLERLGLIITSEEDTPSVREVVKLLLAAGVDPTQRDNDQFTALDIASVLGTFDVMDELSPSMTSMYASRGTYSSSWPLACIDVIPSSTREALERLLKTMPLPSNNSVILKRAISTGDTKLVEALLQSTTRKLNQKDITSALQFCARWGLLSMIQCLLPCIQNIDDVLPSLLDSATTRSLCNIEMVKLLIRSAACIHPVNATKHVNSPSALHRLALGRYWWHPQALTSLLEAGADTELLQKGNTLLQTALEAGRPDGYYMNIWADEVFEILIRFGANVNACSDWSENSPLQVALENKRDVGIIQKLLDHGASIEGRPMAASAIRAKNTSTLELILKAGADPNSLYTVDKDWNKDKQETPLKHASGINEALMEVLLRYGANPHQPLYNGTSSVLHEICALNGSVSPIINAGYDLETRDSQGQTPLIRACRSSRLYSHRTRSYEEKMYTAIELIRAGVDVNAQDDSGSTALHYGISLTLHDVVDELLQRGASSVARNKNGLTPLHCALTTEIDLPGAVYDDSGVRSSRLVRRLLAAGADPLDPLPNGRTALHCLMPGLMQLTEGDREREHFGEPEEHHDSYADYTALYQTFIDSGCSREARDNEGNTPIFDYVSKAREFYSDIEQRITPDPEVVRATLTAHDIHAVNNAGDTLLHAVASREGDCDGDQVDDVMLFKMLVDLGLDPTAENKDGATPLDLASAYDRDEILALFARDE